MSGYSLPIINAVVLSIPLPYLGDRTDDKLFERGSIEIGKLLEVQASLAHPVLVKLGQQRSLFLSFSHYVNHQFSTADGKACQRGFPGSSSLPSEADNPAIIHARS